MIAPDHPPLTINRADPVTVAIKGDPKVQFFFRDKGLQIGQVLFFGRVGMMVGEIAVHFGEKPMMITRQQLGELKTGRAKVRTPITNAQLVSARPLATNNTSNSS